LNSDESAESEGRVFNLLKLVGGVGGLPKVVKISLN
jgi:hypothetical protein